MKFILIVFLMTLIIGCSSVGPLNDDPGVELQLGYDQAKALTFDAMEAHNFDMVSPDAGASVKGVRNETGETIYVWLDSVDANITRIRVRTYYSAFGKEIQRDWSWPLIKDIIFLTQTTLAIN